MGKSGSDNTIRIATFGKRKIRPRACVVEGKRHIRAFLVEALEELGFIACECGGVDELEPMLDMRMPDLVVFELSIGGIDATKMLRALAARTFRGKVLFLGPPGCSIMANLEELAEKLEIEMLPALHTPFGEERLRASVSALLPAEEPPAPPVCVDEAMREGWLELWYQPQIDTRSLTLERAEGLIRIRHPTWGVISPAYFIPDDGDPHSRALSEHVIGRAFEDWGGFVNRHGPMEIAINLPIAYLRDDDAVRELCHQMPDGLAFRGLIIEVNGTEVIRNLALMKDVARQFRFYNIAISIDDLGAEWPLLAGLNDFPFVEIKVDRKFVARCADDRLKQTVCRRILELAHGYGARAVAEGIETKSDFLAVREMGFDKVQGFYFAKPATAKKFARNMLGRAVHLPA